MNRYFRKYGLKCSKSDYALMLLQEKEEVNIYKMIEICRLTLRNCIWCNITDASGDSRFAIDFGWDYYVHIACDKLSEEMIETLEKIGIYIEEWQ